MSPEAPRFETGRVILSFSFQEKPLERSNVRHTTSSRKLPLGVGRPSSGRPSMLASRQRTDASLSVKPKALATSLFCSPRYFFFYPRSKATACYIFMQALPYFLCSKYSHTQFQTRTVFPLHTLAISCFEVWVSFYEQH